MRNDLLGWSVALGLLVAAPAFSQQSAARPSAPAQTAASAGPRTPSPLLPGSIVSIVAGHGGWHGCETAIPVAFNKKKVPLVVAEKDSTPAFRIECEMNLKRISKWKAVVTNGIDKHEAYTSYRVVDLKTGIVIYTYIARELVSPFGSYDILSADEAFAKHLKNFIKKGGRAR